MVHLLPLPGTPKHKHSIKEIVDKAVKEARLYRACGLDGLIIENMHDVPYVNGEAGHEISTLMGIVGYEIKRQTNLPCGIQILAAANKAAMATALSAGLDFIRAEGFVFGHVADEGYIDANGADLLRYRKMIGADHVAVWTDIKKKHSSHSITADVDIVETAKAAEFFLSDGLIVTGTSTGSQASAEEIKAVKEGSQLPVMVGSGITAKNVLDYLPFCDGLIIGSYFKKDGYWENELDKNRIEGFMGEVRSERKNS